MRVVPVAVVVIVNNHTSSGDRVFLIDLCMLRYHISPSIGYLGVTQDCWYQAYPP